MSFTLNFAGTEIALSSSTDIEKLRNDIDLIFAGRMTNWIFIEGEYADYQLHIPSGGPIFIRDDGDS